MRGAGEPVEREPVGCTLRLQDSGIMSKTSVDIDDDPLERARGLLGTSSIKETVHCALREVVRAEARRQEVAALAAMDGLGLADGEIMKNAWAREDTNVA